MKKILVLTKRLAKSPDSWLVDELVFALAEANTSVTVIVFQVDGSWAPGSHKLGPNVEAHVFPVLDPSSRGNVLRKYAAFFPRWLSARRRALKLVRRDVFDCVISFSFFAFFFRFTDFARAANKYCKSLFILWDFFPIHQQQIGKIRSRWLCNVLYRLERREVMGADLVALMSQGNVNFFREYFPGYKGKTIILPVWGSRVEENLALKISENTTQNDKLKLVFGGQLELGRGLHQLLRVAKKYKGGLADVEILIIGSGSLKDFILGEIRDNELENVKLLERVDRETYLGIVSECDAGLVITVSDVSVPTFPSKIIDYMRARKPVIACVEESTDFGDFVENLAVCGLAVSAGDDRQFFEAIRKFVDMKNLGRLPTLGQSGYEYFCANMDVTKIAEIILAEIAPGAQGNKSGEIVP